MNKMKMIPFSLIPFDLPRVSLLPEKGGRLTGELGLIGPEKGKSLSVHYHWQGPAGILEIPPLAPQPQRASGLWETTCFELFLKKKGQPEYVELNFSPSGHWNVFQFKDYRKDMEEISSFRDGDITVTAHQEEQSFSFQATFPLAKILSEGTSKPILQIAVSAILEFRGSGKTYWALNHGESKPDFHRPESFSLLFSPSP